MFTVFVPIVLVSGIMFHGVGSTYNQCNYMSLVGARWYYDWGANPPLCAGIEAVPMIYGAGGAGKPVGGNSEWVLWFNEPELTGQDNFLTPEQAAQLWNDNVDKYPGKKHVSPGVTDLVWLSRFLSLVSRKPDAIAIHYYAWRGLDTEIARTTEFLRQAVDLAQRYGIGEVWLTEWAALPSYMGQDGALEYERRVLTEILPSFPQITRQAWFQVSYLGTEEWAFGPENNTSLVDYNTGIITPFGQVYKEKVGGQTVNPNWDERADVTKDGVVDIFDIALVAGHYGDKKYI
jgi:hypothetical protein